MNEHHRPNLRIVPPPADYVSERPDLYDFRTYDDEGEFPDGISFPGAMVMLLVAAFIGVLLAVGRS